MLSKTRQIGLSIQKHGKKWYHELPPPPKIEQRRVVVTGMGAVTPLGVGVEESWKRLIEGECGIKSIDTIDTTGLASTIAAMVPTGDEEGAFQPEAWLDSRNKRSQSVNFIAYAMCAAELAIRDAQWSPASDEERERAGVAIGAGIGNLEDIIDSGTKPPRRVSPFFVPRVLINLAAGHVSIAHGLKGPNHSCVTACATGAHSIGDASRFIRNGDADVMVAGGSESSINPISIAGFCRSKALTTKFNDNPIESSRPFDSERDGFVMGEGAGVLVLEEMDHALNRGARIYGEVRGYGLSGDAHHITAPEEHGDGARRAMLSALRQSGLQATDIGYINAHATSTPLGDLAEHNAIKATFGDHAYNLGVSSTKGAIGHLLGAAGAVEAIFALKALHENVMPPTLNLQTPSAEFDLNYVPLLAQEKVLDAVLTNSFGFGGTNASLCFSKV